MEGNTVFQSRTAKLSCTGEEFYNFITDIRNFGEFVTADIVKEWEASPDHCRFRVSPIGDIRLKITGRKPYSLVTFSGDALQRNDFVIKAFISENSSLLADVKLVIEAELNPVLRMMASGPVERFLETLADEMEKYNGWGK
jgi:hypothetical protein